MPNFYIHVYNSVLRPFQDYFSSHDTGQSVGRTKTGEPREKPPDTRKPIPKFCYIKVGYRGTLYTNVFMMKSLKQSSACGVLNVFAATVAW